MLEIAQYHVPCAVMLFRHDEIQRWNCGICDTFWQSVKRRTSPRQQHKLRIAQPALGRQVQDLEEEIGVDLVRPNTRGVTLTAEGKLFLEEVRELLKRSDESVQKVRALARGEYGELQVGYAPSPTAEILPPALAAFQKAVPGVKVLLCDLSSDELIAALQNASLELAIMVQPTGSRPLLLTGRRRGGLERLTSQDVASARTIAGAYNTVAD